MCWNVLECAYSVLNSRRRTLQKIDLETPFKDQSFDMVKIFFFRGGCRNVERNSAE